MATTISFHNRFSTPFFAEQKRFPRPYFARICLQAERQAALIGDTDKVCTFDQGYINQSVYSCRTCRIGEGGVNEGERAGASQSRFSSGTVAFLVLVCDIGVAGSLQLQGLLSWSKLSQLHS